jgi:hypothetical protein
MTVPGGRMDSFVVGRCRKEGLCGRGDPSRECAAGSRRGCREVMRMSARSEMKLKTVKGEKKVW